MERLLDNILLLIGSRERKTLDYVLLYGGDKNLSATIAAGRRTKDGPKRIIENVVMDAWSMGLIDDTERSFLRDYIHNLWTPSLLIYELTHEKITRS